VFACYGVTEGLRLVGYVYVSTVGLVMAVKEVKQSGIGSRCLG